MEMTVENLFPYYIIISLYVSGTEVYIIFTQPFPPTSEPLRIIFHLSFFRHHNSR
jgi:hypothetical protein